MPPACLPARRGDGFGEDPASLPDCAAGENSWSARVGSGRARVGWARPGRRVPGGVSGAPAGRPVKRAPGEVLRGRLRQLGVPREAMGRRGVSGGVEAPPPTLGSDLASRAAGGAAGDRPPRAHRPFSRPAREAPALPPPAREEGATGTGRRALDPSAAVLTPLPFRAPQA